MEKFHIGSGVYRAKDNTMLYEVYSAEQMEVLISGQNIYAWMQKKGLKGGFHGVKIRGSLNKHGRVVFENMDQITLEQRSVIQGAMEVTNPPEVVYDPVSGMPEGIKHDYSKDFNLAVEDGVDHVESGGNNVGEDGEKAAFDESFMEADDVKSDGHSEDGSEGSQENGGVDESAKPEKPAPKAGANGKSNKKSGGKPKSSGK